MSRLITGAPAPRWRRLVATLIDAALVPSMTIFLIMALGIVEHAEDFMDWWWTVHVLALAIFSYLLINAYLLWTKSQTIGKKIMGLAIVEPEAREDGTFYQASFLKLVFFRAWFFPILFIGIVPYFTILPLADILFIFSKNRRCLHDYLCRTTVISLTSETSS